MRLVGKRPKTSTPAPRPASRSTWATSPRPLTSATCLSILRLLARSWTCALFATSGNRGSERSAGQQAAGAVGGAGQGLGDQDCAAASRGASELLEENLTLYELQAQLVGRSHWQCVFSIKDAPGNTKAEEEELVKLL
eukprot:TRINITY_DN12553_c0_g1_i5.p1 TRINITY_DN12553_c0_g1~~TRINITY_DN12553_c0_g1_i5.p1  ORF type:complete len:138 (+),score=15.78 TRINITY_DN12553_c0_g1_i5:289-702(+)